MIGAMSEGDLIVFPSLDRMGRNYNDIIEQWNLITKTKKCDIKVVDMDLLDTTSRGGTITGQFISDIVLQILSYVAETERLKIQSRVISGLANVKSKGVILGRPKVKLPDNYEEVFNQYNNKTISSREAMGMLNLKRSTFFYLIKEYNAKYVKEDVK